MAQLLVWGTVATVELTIDPEEGGVIATCQSCGWTETYDDLRDAYEYTEDHADSGPRECAIGR
jgi:RNase P subunit RPR2